MNDTAAPCAFCGEPTEYKVVETLDIGNWGDGTIRKPRYGNVCVNEDCHSYGQQVATK